MDQAIVAAEDRSFYTEGGISITGAGAGRLRGPQGRQRQPGRLHPDRAVRQELLHGLRVRQQQRQVGQRQAQAGPGRHQAGSHQVQVVDPDPVPQHRVPRRELLRSRSGGAGVLRRAGQQAHRPAGRDAGRAGQRARPVQPRPERRLRVHRPGRALAVRALRTWCATATSRWLSSRACRAVPRPGLRRARRGPKNFPNFSHRPWNGYDRLPHEHGGAGTLRALTT